MPLTKLQFRPGINREVTPYSNEGGWTDCDKVRFRFGYPEKIGGWEKYSSNTYQGTARNLHSWNALDSSDYLGIGTHLKYYIEEGETFNDVTPVRSSTTNSTTFSATNGSTTITVTETNHGASAGDFVTFSSAVSLGGVITATILNIEYQIVSITNANTYTVTSSVAANASDSGNGGSATDAVYQLNVGLDSAIGGTGWGACQWGGTTSGALTTQLNEALDNSETAVDVDDETGITTDNDVILVEEELMIVTATGDDNTLTVARGHSGTAAVTHVDNTIVRLAVGNASSSDDFVGWGQAGTIAAEREIRLWSSDNFDEDLLINPRDGGIYYWDKTNGLSTRAIAISSLGGASSNIPTIAKQVLVSNDFHVFAFGCNTYGTTTQDPLLIWFSHYNSPENWTVSNETSANFFRLGSGSTFMQALKTKREILAWTDKSLHAIRYVGFPFWYRADEISSNVTIMSPSAAIATEDVVFWMGIDTFYVYSGGTQQLPCTVKDKVFNDFNYSQKDKVFSAINSEFGEVIWFYPSDTNSLANEGTGDIDRYVVYNYQQKVWYFGSLARTAWIDRGLKNYPIAASSSYLYNHEYGNNDDGSAMTSYIESGPMDIGDGDRFSLIQKVIPDITFDGSDSSSSPVATFSIKAKNNPGTNFNETDDDTVTRTATTPVEQFTNKIYLRARGRSFALRVASSTAGMKWRLGSPRVELRPDGRQ